MISYAITRRVNPSTTERGPHFERARARRLHLLLARMTPTRRIVVTLMDLEELPAPRVAEILGCPEATVRSRLRRGRIDLEALVLADPFFREEIRRGGP